MAKEMYSYVVIDNAPSSVETVNGLADKVPWLQSMASFTDPFEGMYYLNKHQVDLLFLDIDMPGLMGTELLRMLKEPPVTVFCTGHREFALDGFDLEIVDFLLKPFSFERFYSAALRARKLMRKPLIPESLETIRDDVLAVRLDRGLHSIIDVRHINYVLADDDRSIISVDPTCQTGEWVDQAQQEKRIYTRMRFGELTERLSIHRFIQIHRGHIVALDRIQYVLPEGFVQLSMPAGKRLSITEANKRALIHWFGSRK